jgi:peptidylprolyl isomerase
VAPPDVAVPPRDARKLGSGVVTKVLRPGSGSVHFSDNDCAELSFMAWKRDGALFSASGPHGESSVQCLNTAIPGLALALQSRGEGEKRRVWIPAQLSFVDHMAHHPGKPMPVDETPRVDLTFDLELIRILKAPPTPNNLATPPRTASWTPSGVAIQVLRPGVGTVHPTVNSRVKVNYTVWGADGKVYESTVMSEHPATFLLGTALAGWREALPRMVPGEKASLWIPAALAYGDHPANPMLPAGPVVYDLELMELQ